MWALALPPRVAEEVKDLGLARPGAVVAARGNLGQEVVAIVGNLGTCAG